MSRRLIGLLALCLVAQLGGAEDTPWEWVTPLPQGHDLFAAASGNGVTVAVGRGGTVIASADGGEWRTSHTADGYSLMDVVWANGLFVAVGGEVGFEFSPGLGVILTSENGIDWVERHRENSLSLEAVVWTGSRFVAVGIGYGALFSSDGLLWSKSDFDDSEYIWDLAWNGSLLVAIGRDGYFGGELTFFASQDGEMWQQTAMERVYEPHSIAALAGRFVAIGSEGDALVSDDGLTWTVAPHDSPRQLRVIVDGGDRFLATGNDVVASSIDGYVWTIEDVPMDSRVNGLAWLGDSYLAVGNDGFMMSSPDGSEWTQLSTRAFGISGHWEINELATDGATIVGVGEGGLIVTGRHGTEWARRFSPADSELNAVIWTGSAFWAVGGARVMRSTDGVHWAEQYFDPEVNLSDVVWNGSLLVAVGWNASHSEAQRLILTSSDGHTWTSHWFDIEDVFFTVGWTGSGFVAIGRGAHYLISSDGTTWEQHVIAEGVTLRDSAWNGNRLVAVGGRSESGGVVFSTTDGVEWLESVLPEPAPSGFDDVTWTGTHFVAVSRSSGDVVFTSTDGLLWSAETTGTGVWPVSVVGDERSLTVTGRGLQIIRRTKPLADPDPPRRPARRVAPAGDHAQVIPAIQR